MYFSNFTLSALDCNTMLFWFNILVEANDYRLHHKPVTDPYSALIRLLHARLPTLVLQRRIKSEFKTLAIVHATSLGVERSRRRRPNGYNRSAVTRPCWLEIARLRVSRRARTSVPVWRVVFALNRARSVVDRAISAALLPRQATAFSAQRSWHVMSVGCKSFVVRLITHQRTASRVIWYQHAIRNRCRPVSHTRTNAGNWVRLWTDPSFYCHTISFPSYPTFVTYRVVTEHWSVCSTSLCGLHR